MTYIFLAYMVMAYIVMVMGYMGDGLYSYGQLWLGDPPKSLCADRLAYMWRCYA